MDTIHHPLCPRNDPTRSNAPCMCGVIPRDVSVRPVTARPAPEGALFRGALFGCLLSAPIYLGLIALVVYLWKK